MKNIKRLAVSVLIFMSLLCIVAALSSCRGSGPEKESLQSRSKKYELYTEMLEKYSIGAEYDDITAYLDEIEVAYTEKTQNSRVPQIQVYGGQLFFTSSRKLNSVTSTKWQTHDGWGVGSSLDDIEAVYGEGKKLENTKNPVYVYTTENEKYTVTFDEHFIVTHWTLS